MIILQLTRTTPNPTHAPLRSQRWRPAWLLAMLILAISSTAIASAQSTPIPTMTAAAADPLGLLVSDSELVYGLTLYNWDIAKFVADQGGLLANFSEPVDGQILTGAEIVQRVAEDHSVGPRTLLALVEMTSGWVRNPSPAERNFALAEPLPGLFAGLSSAAGQLNAAYYAHRAGQRTIQLADQKTITVPNTNAGTFAVLAYLSRNVTLADWPKLEAASHFYMVWTSLFGDPFDYQVDPTLPDTLPPASLQLPFGPGEVWYLVEGPHSAWGPGTPRAAVDLAPPPAEATGCAPSSAWVTAAAPGVVTRARASGVVVDLDGDGFDGGGWANVYSHLADEDRVAAGTQVATGDRLGHPSCAGGLPTQARVSFSRKFNGEWLPVDQPGAPLELGSWTVLVGPTAGTGWMVAPGIPPRQANGRKVDNANGIIPLAGGTGP